jgi:eukaryotic-like serine/threonine-protein kinase
MIGQTLAHYGFEGLLGEGGSGLVYRGRDLRLERPVAIKVLADALRDDELAWARLLREARLASQLNHPHIATIHDLGEEDGRAYIVMEYVEGLPLADLIPEGGMPLEQVKRYTEQITDALAFAHEHGTLHGDLKGSNIIVTPEGNTKLLDFGLGRRIPRNGTLEVSSSKLPLAEIGATAGTLPYLAPEVLRGNPTSVQSDVWSLGVLIYQMATGELPFRGSTPFELSVEIMMATPANLWQLPEPLQSTLRRCLEKNPDARFPQVRELSTQLQQPSSTEAPADVECLPALDETPPPSDAVEASIPVAPSTHLHKWWAATAAAALCLLLSGGIYSRHVRGLSRPATPIPAASKAPTPAATENPDATVWVNTDSGTYHCPGTRWYGKTHVGEYMKQKRAKEKGYRPAAHQACL